MGMCIRMVRGKRGQFILIAALLIAIMIVSVTAILYSSVTYFRHERWEEYLIVIDGVKAGTSNLLRVSLANYTQTSNNSVLKTTLDLWRADLKKAYTGYGVLLGYSLASGAYSAYGMNPINYNQGLASTWNQRVSFSAANATVNLNITSVELTGYRFASVVFLKMNITDVLWYAGKGNDPGQVGVRVVIYEEGPTPVTNLQKSNFVLFQVGGVNQSFTLYRYYEGIGHEGSPALNAFVYELRYSASSKPASVAATIGVVDTRSIKVRGQATLTTINA